MGWWDCNFYLFGVVEHVGDYLAVPLQDGHHLARVLVEDCHVLIVSAGDYAGRVAQADVQGEDAGHRDRVQTLQPMIGPGIGKGEGDNISRKMTPGIDTALC